MFQCPKCGGHKWGTDLTKNRGHCHGTLQGKPCTFTWKRDEDDKYGIGFTPKAITTGRVSR